MVWDPKLDEFSQNPVFWGIKPEFFVPEFWAMWTKSVETNHWEETSHKVRPIVDLLISESKLKVFMNMNYEVCN